MQILNQKLTTKSNFNINSKNKSGSKNFSNPNVDNMNICFAYAVLASIQ
jgi:hypothetical protein